MPWVRLHGVKDYYGMAMHLLEFPEMRCTINLVPSLLYQLQGYTERGGTDLPLSISRRPADGLSEEDCLYILDAFFRPNAQTMIRPFPRYYDLLRRRAAGRNTAREALRRFNERDFRDLQVWFNLTWIHPLAIELDPTLLVPGRWDVPTALAALAAAREVIADVGQVSFEADELEGPLRRLAEERGRILMVALNRHLDPANLYARELIRSGALGEPSFSRSLQVGYPPGGFYKDPERYINTYWSRFPDVWVHGDFALIDSDNLWYILGRSDDTIKVAGKRVGPAEVEGAAMEHPGVMESAAIGIPDPIKGQAVVVFCVLRPDSERSEKIEEEIRETIGEKMGKPFMPKAVHIVHDLPKTRNAKIMRRVIRSAYLGEAAGDLSALLNPEAVEEIRSLFMEDKRRED